jgi:hypothetical protein
MIRTDNNSMAPQLDIQDVIKLSFNEVLKQTDLPPIAHQLALRMQVPYSTLRIILEDKGRSIIVQDIDGKLYDSSVKSLLESLQSSKYTILGYHDISAEVLTNRVRRVQVPLL